MRQFLAKLKNPYVSGGIVIGLLLIAGVTFVTLTYLNANKPTSTKLVAPKVIQKSLVNANDTAKKESDAHIKATDAIDEKQVKLAE
ncbi:MAG: hypothetical protein H6797_01665 [Candidatus Nomurabacteria bacterium]|nr:MAG: hypothetical protein H6797_01665 [Candidatus Nomurabacteria bacterium]